MKHRRVVLSLFGVSVVLGLSMQASAQESGYLLGDWGGKRSALEDQGVQFSFNYTSEDAHNLSGGTREVTSHAGQFALGTQLDLDKLWGWDGVIANAVVSHRDGDNLNSRAGLNQLLQSQETFGRGDIWRLSDLWISKTFADGALRLKAGRVAVGKDFDSLDCMGMDLTFCGSQPAMFAGDYWMNGPVSQWGMVIDVHPGPTWYVRIGAYQVNPSYADETGGGLRLAPSGTTGTLTPAEIGWTPNFAGLDGMYVLGGWYSSAPRQDAYADRFGGSSALSGRELAMRTGAYGGFLSAHQQLTHGNGDDPHAGLRLAFDGTQTDKRTGKIDRTLHLIGTYTGLSEARPHDTLALGIGATHVNGRYTDYQRDWNTVDLHAPVTVQDGNEYTAELVYTWFVLPGLNFQPVFQYVTHPGASSANPDVAVIGVRTNLSF